MEYRNLGKSGLKVSALSFGSWVTFGQQIGDDVAEGCMKAAWDAGVNFFDNAEVYASGKSEEVMGRILKKMGRPRDEFIVSSKVFWGGDKPTQNGLNRKHVVEACHAACKRLQVDYLDLYFCHRPDEETPIGETVETMTSLIRQGKVFYWGTSEWSVQQIMEAHMIARENSLIAPTMEQPQYNMFNRGRLESEYRRLYETVGLGTTIWSPLASGLLTGKYNTEKTPEDTRINLKGYDWLKKNFEAEETRTKLRKVEELMEVAQDLGTNMPRLALAWCLKNPRVSTVITGASKVEQVEDNMQAIEVVEKLTDDVMTRIEEILDNKP